MALEIIWSPNAIKRFEEIIDFLNENWTEREIKIFIKKTVKVLAYISDNPKMFRKSLKRKSTHEALISKQVMLIYQLKPAKIELLTFWDTRQHPRKKFR